MKRSKIILKLMDLIELQDQAEREELKKLFERWKKKYE